MPEFILMLTCDDRTIEHAHAVYDEIKDVPGLHYVGFKDIGLPFAELASLARAIRLQRQQVVLEVVSETAAAELRAARAAIELGVDYLLGGTHARDVAPLLAGSTIRYWPFPGRVVGHPNQLLGDVPEIVESARRLADIPGVSGLDVLAYRSSVDGRELLRELVANVSIPVIAAGSIDSDVRLRAVAEAGVWGFTVGSAVLRGLYPLGDTLRERLTHLVEIRACGARGACPTAQGTVGE